MPSTDPFFSERLLVTAPDGTYGGWRSRRRIRAFDDRIELGEIPIHYQYLAQLRVYGNVLHVVYVASDGKQVEQFFRHDTFLTKTGAKALQAMAVRVNGARSALVKPSVWRRDEEQVKEAKVIKAELLDSTNNGWQRAGIYSALVAFPAVCPVCLRPAEMVGRLDASGGLNEKGSWLVPTCREHEKAFTGHFAIANWRAGRSRLEFTIWNRDYARLFISLNNGELTEDLRRITQSAPLLFDIKNGLRLVQYQYAVSAILISFLMPSSIQSLQRGQSAVAKGLRFSLISLIAGWWGIPAGPIFTIASIVRNFRGGIDLTATVEAVLTGSAVSAGGYR
ncbi:MAG: hypothetical protein QOJ98_2055 [Acidobacteriota bacterium]|nr:hypothetical protein [Acidobacteriota bacterium]